MEFSIKTSNTIVNPSTLLFNLWRQSQCDGVGEHWSRPTQLIYISADIWFVIDIKRFTGRCVRTLKSHGSKSHFWEISQPSQLTGATHTNKQICIQTNTQIYNTQIRKYAKHCSTHFWKFTASSTQAVPLGICANAELQKCKSLFCNHNNRFWQWPCPKKIKVSKQTKVFNSTAITSYQSSLQIRTVPNQNHK